MFLGLNPSTSWAWESASGYSIFSILYWEKPKMYLANHSEPLGIQSKM